MAPASRRPMRFCFVSTRRGSRFMTELLAAIFAASTSVIQSFSRFTQSS